MTNVVINNSHFDVSLFNDDASIEKIENINSKLLRNNYNRR